MNVTLTYTGTTPHGLATTFNTTIEIAGRMDYSDFVAEVEAWLTEIREQLGLPEDAEIRYAVADYEDIPEHLMAEAGPNETAWEYIEAMGNKDKVNEAMWWAAEGLDIPADTVEEAYAGTARSDEEFAENLANDLGLIPDNVEWPMTHIDWESAAASLMSDYTENDGFYFRDM